MFSLNFKSLIIIAAALLLSDITVTAQDKSIPKDLYLAAAIPDSLKQDANAVIRYFNTEITIGAPGRRATKVHKIITVLNEKADDYAALVLGYDKKFLSINNMQLLAYNADGKLIKKYTKGDAYDHSAIDDGTMMSDDRLLALGHRIASYPTTIEIIYETSASSYLSLPEWNIQPDEVAVQNSVCRVAVNPEVGFRYKNKNIALQPKKENNGKFDVYTWQVSNLKAFVPEDEVPEWTVAKSIVFAADKFEFAGIPGDISTWQNFGKWYLSLNASACNFTPQREEEIRQMTAACKTDQDKARYLYNYLQKNMRYVGVQLGIGGFKSFPASYVDKNKYGDCKALSNYMYSLLKAVGIRSHYTIINAGDNDEPADSKFPANAFNHIILCIPFKGDTTWLECTSNTQPYGKLGTMTENRKALIITEDGGQLVNTPRSTSADNTFNSKVNIKLNADGGAIAQAKILATGGYRDIFVGLLPTINEDKRKEYLMRWLNFKQPQFFDIKQSLDSAGVHQVNFELDYDTFTEASAGLKKFYRPRVFDLWGATLPVLDKRRGDYYFDHPMQKECTTVISLPEGYEAESVPENVSLKFSYGTYQANYKYDATKNEVVCTVKFNMDRHVIPAAKYAEMQKYMDDIAKAQNKKLIVKKKKA